MGQPLSISLDAASVLDLLRRDRWWDLKSLRALLGPDSRAIRALAHDCGPDAGAPEYGFLAADATEAYGGAATGVTRLLVVLRWPGGNIPPALVAFDFVRSADAAVAKRWQLESPQDTLAHAAVLPAAAEGRAEAAFLNLLRAAGGSREAPADWEPITSVELAGVRVADRVVVFHLDSYASASAISFDVRGEGILKYLVTGLAPGNWEIWRNGFLEDQGTVKPPAGALYFEREAGGFFLRRTN